MLNQCIWKSALIENKSLIAGVMIYLTILETLYLTNKRSKFKVKQIIYEVLLSIYTMALLKVEGMQKLIAF
ncbi:hypothetical protein K0040_09570 [Terrisporobacter petrolearius]|uniref:hypothetical protein n=1 Tax=Terrisporobacter petrolearius TaxID=1460447 RepID=UPI001D161CB6|nr:hypothetical protein [Terrisporobacter petrolearius]MCC3864564.1 hypothetical protein [Terrisporobacter petrolearius]